MAQTNRPVQRSDDRVVSHPSGDERFALLDKVLKRSWFEADQLIEILHAAQEIFGYLSEDVMLYVARALRLPLSRVFGVATFYHLFNLEEPGDHTFTVCTGTACFVKGADAIVDALQREHSIAAGGTTDDGRFSLKTARCLGACGLAPIGVLDGEVRGELSADAALTAVAGVLEAAPDAGEDAGQEPGQEPPGQEPGEEPGQDAELATAGTSGENA